MSMRYEYDKGHTGPYDNDDELPTKSRVWVVRHDGRTGTIDMVSSR